MNLPTPEPDWPPCVTLVAMRIGMLTGGGDCPGSTR